MCELTDASGGRGRTYLAPGEVVEFPDGGSVMGFGTPEGQVLQCWHPETSEWRTMLQPVEGTAWQLGPRSRLRVVYSDELPAPEMVEQVEASRA
jgi:hypothetical protein